LDHGVFTDSIPIALCWTALAAYWAARKGARRPSGRSHDNP
jgi:hypothetical protein